MYHIFDIYNNAYNLGGKLQVVFDRFLVMRGATEIYLSKSTIYPKTRQRKTLNDLTVRISVIVRTRIHISFFEYLLQISILVSTL